MISSTVFPIQKYSLKEIKSTDDHLAVEEPLEIRISYNDSEGKLVTKPISVTMRTPGEGQDSELAAGFLLTEGIVHYKDQLKEALQIDEHIVLIKLNDKVKPDISKLERHFYTTSSCGVCGKTSIEAVKVTKKSLTFADKLFVSPDIIYSLPNTLSKNQKTFEATGGLHASALFDIHGTLLSVREDVGRHNALDKLIGYALLEKMLPLNNHILLLSGRASFELIQKATMAGISIVCAVGAPSSLAVQLATEFNITLIGFLREERFNIYCANERVKFN